MGISDAKGADPSGLAREDDLVHAYVLDGKGGGARLDWMGVRAWTRDQGPLWVHLNRLGEVAPRCA